MTNHSVVPSSYWSLDPSVIFLNHGSFGACPRVVLDAQWRETLEEQPVKFFMSQLEAGLDASRKVLGEFLHVDPLSLAWVRNATGGVNAVLRSLRFASGDELLTTDHSYNACRNALDFVADRSGARVVVAQLPLPLSGQQEVVDAILSKVTPRTRIAVLDHVTSPTAVVMPIRDLTHELAVRGIETLVDGAHAPGMLDVDLGDLGATYYTGNCHKWLCAPKGAAFLYTAPERQSDIRPTVISHGANSPRRDRSRYLQEFDWVGTDDPTSVLCVPAAIEFLKSLMPGGVAALLKRNHELAVAARSLLIDAVGTPRLVPESMIGSMATIRLPESMVAVVPPDIDSLQETLWQEHRIEVPVISWPQPPQRLIRISAQAYNELSHFETLAAALRKLLVASPG